MSPLVLSLSLVVLLPFTLAQLSNRPPAQMTYKEMMSPKLAQNLEWCNLPKNTEPRVGTDQQYFICDPHRMLSLKDITAINWILRDAAKNGTTCPCSNYYCEFPKREHTMTGYHISVALVNKMKIENNIVTNQPNSLEDQSNDFANKLVTGSWKFGRCEEDIVVLYSREDQMLAVHGARTAANKLSRVERELLVKKSGHFFGEGRIAAGLHEMLHDMKILLNCDSENMQDCEAHLQTSGSGIMTFSVTLACLCLAAVASLWA